MAQARLIVVSPPTTRGGRHVGLSITNYSTAPIFDVDVDFVVYYEDPNVQGLPSKGTTDPVLVLAAGESKTYGVVVTDLDGKPVVATANSPIHEPTRRELHVTFMDAAGLRWQRTGLGQPVRLIEAEPRSRRGWWLPWRHKG
ncbi:hypothetical protein GCM10009675_31230 [Prauserella alba]|uniref:Uncharacterized protein n=1 Tax=Prauserella alba TaxID=176898 RepID=A0ABP4G0D7_9PSEU